MSFYFANLELHINHHEIKLNNAPPPAPWAVWRNKDVSWLLKTDSNNLGPYQGWHVDLTKNRTNGTWFFKAQAHQFNYHWEEAVKFIDLTIGSLDEWMTIDWFWGSAFNRGDSRSENVFLQAQAIALGYIEQTAFILYIVLCT